MMSMRSLNLMCGITLFAVGPCIHAQDTRTVTEPRIPQTCIKLQAQLAATGDALAGASLAESDEHSPDTQRIQQAIDSYASRC